MTVPILYQHRHKIPCDFVIEDLNKFQCQYVGKDNKNAKVNPTSVSQTSLIRCVQESVQKEKLLIKDWSNTCLDECKKQEYSYEFYQTKWPEENPFQIQNFLAEATYNFTPPGRPSFHPAIEELNERLSNSESELMV